MIVLWLKYLPMSFISLTNIRIARGFFHEQERVLTGSKRLFFVVTAMY
jgi:hypothetical protein